MASEASTSGTRPGWKTATAPLASTLLTLIGGLLVAGYIVPNTWISSKLPEAQVQNLLSAAQVHWGDRALIAVCALAVWAAYCVRLSAVRLWDVQAVWCTLLAYMLLCVASIFSSHGGSLEGPITTIMAPLTIGLLAALFCGSATRTLTVVAILASIQACFTTYLYCQGQMISQFAPPGGGHGDAWGHFSARFLWQ
jgi:hypothetical protein